MKAAILSIGTELMLGDILNTNERYIAKVLTERGYQVIEESTVADDYDQLFATYARLDGKVDVVVTSGGIGPTKDDFTKETLADYLGRKIYLDEGVLEEMKKYYKKKGYTLNDNNIKQAYMIEGSKALINHWGTAAGEHVQSEKTSYFLFPGPPRELEPMVDTYLKKYLKTDQVIKEASIQLINIGEAQAEALLRKMTLPEEAEVNTFAHYGTVEVKSIVKGKDEDLVDEKLEACLKILKENFKDNIYGTGDEKIEEKILQLCTEKGLRLSFAESVTGGLLAKRLTSYSGASAVLNYSLVSYSNQVKEDVLGVKEETIKTYGVVSKETAEEMAAGLYKKSYGDVAISTTGEAGPSPQEKEKGLVYLGFHSGDKHFTKELHLQGNRRDIQRQTASHVFYYLLKEFLEENNG